MRKSSYVNYCRSVVACVLLSGAGACSVLAPVAAPEVTEYQLMSVAPVDASSCSANPNGAIIQVTTVRADAPFNSRKMYYSQAQYQLSSYALNECAANPNIMLTQAIEEKLLTSCAYANVVSAEFMTIAKYRLTSQLLDFKQVINGQASTMQFNILVQLVDNETNRVIRSKTFNQHADVDPTPAGYIKGANAVTQTFLTDLSAWLSSN